MSRSKNYCVIMAGGVGSRFWPMSTTQHPKQFQDILGTGRTMIQQTFDRIQKVVPTENIFVITNVEYLELCHEQLPEIPTENIVGEPIMKNTAACNHYMASKISNIDPEANIIVLPADHLIIKEQNFLDKVQLAFELACKNDYLITLGIQPTRPDTGYGYIQFLEEEGKEIYKVKTFTEKPNLEFAKAFLEAGDFLWNAGIFIWNVQSILSSFKTYLPETADYFATCRYNTESEKKDIEIIYPKVDKISIDNGILEKAENVYVIPADLGWSDLGTWLSVFENAQKDGQSNVIQSKNVITYNTEGTIVRIDHADKAAVIDGLKDYIVVDTEKALLICPKSSDQLIKKYVQDVKSLKKGERFV